MALTLSQRVRLAIQDKPRRHSQDFIGDGAALFYTLEHPNPRELRVIHAGAVVAGARINDYGELELAAAISGAFSVTYTHSLFSDSEVSEFLAHAGNDARLATVRALQALVARASALTSWRAPDGTSVDAKAVAASFTALLDRLTDDETEPHAALFAWAGEDAGDQPALPAGAGAGGGAVAVSVPAYDEVSAIIRAGQNITIARDDTHETLTINSAGGGGAVTADAVLDTAQPTRTSADRGKAYGVSQTDEQTAELLEIPAAQVQASWAESDSNSVSYIRDKPTIPTVPARAGAFTPAYQAKVDGIEAGAEVNPKNLIQFAALDGDGIADGQMEFKDASDTQIQSGSLSALSYINMPNNAAAYNADASSPSVPLNTVRVSGLLADRAKNGGSVLLIIAKRGETAQMVIQSETVTAISGGYKLAHLTIHNPYTISQAGGIWNIAAGTNGGVLSDDIIDLTAQEQMRLGDFSAAFENKLAGVASGAEVNVQPDWGETDTSSDAYIRDKPDLSLHDAFFENVDSYSVFKRTFKGPEQLTNTVGEATLTEDTTDHGFGTDEVIAIDKDATGGTDQRTALENIAAGDFVMVDFNRDNTWLFAEVKGVGYKATSLAVYLYYDTVAHSNLGSYDSNAHGNGAIYYIANTSISHLRTALLAGVSGAITDATEVLLSNFSLLTLERLGLKLKPVTTAPRTLTSTWETTNSEIKDGNNLIGLPNPIQSGNAQIRWSLPANVPVDGGGTITVQEVLDYFNYHHAIEVYAGSAVLSGVISSFTNVNLPSGQFYQITLTDAEQTGTFTDGAAFKVQLQSDLVNRNEFGKLAFKDTAGAADIDAGAITQGKIASNAVSSGKLASGAVSTAKIADDAVTADKIAAGVLPSRLIKIDNLTTTFTDCISATQFAALSDSQPIWMTVIEEGNQSRTTSATISKDMITSSDRWFLSPDYAANGKRISFKTVGTGANTKVQCAIQGPNWSSNVLVAVYA